MPKLTLLFIAVLFVACSDPSSNNNDECETLFFVLDGSAEDVSVTGTVNNDKVFDKNISAPWESDGYHFEIGSTAEIQFILNNGGKITGGFKLMDRFLGDLLTVERPDASDEVFISSIEFTQEMYNINCK